MRFFLRAVLLGSSTAALASLALTGCSGTDASINDVGDDDGGGGGTTDGGASHGDGGFDATTGDGATGQDATTTDGSPGGGDASGADGGIEADGEGGALDAGDAGDAADAGPSADDVPLMIDYLTANGSDDVGFGLMVTIGQTQLPALLDTGSAGIRVVMGAVQTSDFESISTTAASVTYGSGTVASGVVATANVTLGSLTTAAPIPVQLITHVDCSADKPDCPAKGESLDQFAFKGESGGTWKVIVGVGMRTSGDGNAIGNPIVQLPGKPPYLIDVSGGYGATSGKLRIAPTPGEAATFATAMMPADTAGGALGNGVTAYDDRQNSVCIDDDTTTMNYCAPALLDCGNAPMVIEWAPQRKSMQLAGGDMVDVTLMSGLAMGSPVLGAYTFTVTNDPRPGQDLVNVDETTDDDSSINTGTMFFFRQKVLEDQTTGTIGVSPF